MTTPFQWQFPRGAAPVGDPADFVEPVFFDGWAQPASQPVYPVEFRYTLPSAFFIGDPSDFGEAPSVPDYGWHRPTSQPVQTELPRQHWFQSVFFEGDPSLYVAPVFMPGIAQPLSQPVYPVEYRYLLESAFFQGDPSDFEVPVPDYGWYRPVVQPVYPVEYRYLLDDRFAATYEEIISTPDLVNFAAWVQPLSQPVYPTEFRYHLPYMFVQIEPDDFVTVSPYALTREIVSLGDQREISSIGDQREIRRLG